MNYSIVTLNSRVYGKVKVKVDKEDKHILNQNISFSICRNADKPYLRKSSGDRKYLQRVILKENNILDESRNVYFKNGNHFDLRKSNLIQK